MKKKKKTVTYKKEKESVLKGFVKECYNLLIQKRNELLKINFKNEITPILEVGDDIDIAQQTLGKEILHELSDTQRNLLDAIETAIEKIEKGEYGICEKCKKPIPKKRLKFLPWARYCIKCQINTEQKT